MKKLLSLLLCAMLALCLLPASADGLTLTDMMDRTVELPAPAAKVVAVTASNVEILYALGAGDTVIGRGEYCDYPAEVMDKPVVKSGTELNVEELVALKPDLVIMDAMGQSSEQVAALENAGLKVLITKEAGIDGVYDAISLIGAAVGKTEEADALNASLKDRFAKVAEAAVQSDLNVYFEISPLQYGLWTAGKGTFMDEIASMLGLKNAFGDLDGWQGVSQEQVIERNPAVIVTTGFSTETMTAAEEIAAREGWQVIDAVKNGAIFQTDSNEFTRPGPRLADAAEHLLTFLQQMSEAVQPAA